LEEVGPVLPLQTVADQQGKETARLVEDEILDKARLADFVKAE